MKLALTPGAPQNLEIVWGEETIVWLDGAEICRVQGLEALRQGLDIGLPDGSTLRLHHPSPMAAFSITRNGEPLPGSPTDPRPAVVHASYALYAVAAMSAAFTVNLIAKRGAGGMGVDDGVALVLAGAYAVLGFVTVKKESRVALAAGLLLYLASGGVAVMAQLRSGNPNMPGC